MLFYVELLIEVKGQFSGIKILELTKQRYTPNGIIC